LLVCRQLGLVVATALIGVAGIVAVAALA